jgi:hypothetical protein
MFRFEAFLVVDAGACAAGGKYVREISAPLPILPHMKSTFGRNTSVRLRVTIWDGSLIDATFAPRCREQEYQQSGSRVFSLHLIRRPRCIRLRADRESRHW